jgi:hypothetical protein
MIHEGNVLNTLAQGGCDARLLHMWPNRAEVPVHPLFGLHSHSWLPCYLAYASKKSCSVLCCRHHHYRHVAPTAPDRFREPPVSQGDRTDQSSPARLGQALGTITSTTLTGTLA